MATFRIRTGNGDEVVYTDKSLHKQMQQRSKRNSLLAKADSKIVTDRGMSESKITEWKTYRQKLRDMDFSDPYNLTWPTKPE